MSLPLITVRWIIHSILDFAGSFLDLLDKRVLSRFLNSQALNMVCVVLYTLFCSHFLGQCSNGERCLRGHLTENLLPFERDFVWFLSFTAFTRIASLTKKYALRLTVPFSIFLTCSRGAVRWRAIVSDQLLFDYQNFLFKLCNDPAELVLQISYRCTRLFLDCACVRWGIWLILNVITFINRWFQQIALYHTLPVTGWSII
jgi:hypothetical protein